MIKQVRIKRKQHRIRNLNIRTFNVIIQISNMFLVIKNVFLDFDKSKIRLGHFLCSLFKTINPPNKSMKQPKPSSSSPSLYYSLLIYKASTRKKNFFLYKAHKPVYQTKTKFISKALLDQPKHVLHRFRLCLTPTKYLFNFTIVNGVETDLLITYKYVSFIQILQDILARPYAV